MVTQVVTLVGIVLIFSAINYGAYVARRAVGDRHGLGIAGMLGGLFSSTAVTFDFSRLSREEPPMARALASGVVGACVVLMPRVLIASAALNPRVSLELLKLLAPALVVGALLIARDWRAAESAPDGHAISAGNPLRLGMAIRMAVLFQLAMWTLAWMRAHYSMKGLYATSAVLGLTDVDALTVAMSRPALALAPETGARAIAVGILANTVLKLIVSAALGGPWFRRASMTGLFVLGVTTAVSLWMY